MVGIENRRKDKENTETEEKETDRGSVTARECKELQKEKDVD